MTACLVLQLKSVVEINWKTYLVQQYVFRYYFHFLVSSLAELFWFNSRNLSAPPSSPGRPVVIDISETKCTLRWEPSEDDGGADVKHYIVEYFRDVWEVWLKAKTTKETIVSSWNFQTAGRLPWQYWNLLANSVWDSDRTDLFFSVIRPQGPDQGNLPDWTKPDLPSPPALGTTVHW